MDNTNDSSLGVQQQCIPIFDGKDYDLWSVKMKTIFLSLDLWELVEKGYVEPDSDSTTTLTEDQQRQLKKKQQQKDASALPKIQQGVSDSVCRIIMEAATAKQAWHILKWTFQRKKGGVREDNEWIRYMPLYEAVDSGKWEDAEEFLKSNPEVLAAIISGDGNTALHVAAQAGRGKIVQKLVEMMKPEDWEKQPTMFYNTTLHVACYGETIEIAKILAEGNPNLLSIAGLGARIPVAEAAFNGNKEMVRYLYFKTLEVEEALNPFTTDILFYHYMKAEIYDIALDLVKRYGMLANSVGTGAASALRALARKPSAFNSGRQLNFCQRLIYSSICVQPPHASNNIAGDIERPHDGPTDRGTMITRVLNQLLVGISSKLFAKVPAIRHMYDEKLKHIQAHQLLVCICKKIFDHDRSQFERDEVHKAIVEATGNGIVEFINEILKIYPNIIWKSDNDGRRIFNYAILHRQEKIFSLFYEMGAKKNILAKELDNDRNNMLHHAALLAPSSKLDHISCAALRMQRELMWFTEVKKIVPPEYRERINNENKTPKALFTEQHKKLVEEGEKWTKETARSCSVVASLIVTIMFAAAFTVPGGYNNDSGIPIFLNDKSFTFFIIADASSFFSSSISLLMFLGILTSRYKEEDFHKSLPTKLKIGLYGLLFSIATMMITFSITLFIVSRKQQTWVIVLFTLLCSIPVFLFIRLESHLINQILFSTYGHGIFSHRPKK